MVMVNILLKSTLRPLYSEVHRTLTTDVTECLKLNEQLLS